MRKPKTRIGNWLRKRKKLNELAKQRAAGSQQMKTFEATFKLVDNRTQKKIKRSIVRDKRKALKKEAKSIKKLIQTVKKQK